jgi:hypothetical protein
MPVSQRGSARSERRAGREKHSVRRIKRIAQFTGARSYLEIGVASGGTFHSADLPRKVAVDPRFRFDPADYTKDGVEFFEIPSDTYFAEKAGTEQFDIIFLDGLHTFEQTYRDFIHSLKHAHDRTVWLIDDVVPSDEFSALPDRHETRRLRHAAGVVSSAWHGDVYKVVFAIHDLHPDYSFVTANTGGNPQTIVWKASPRQVVTPGSMESIVRMDYAEFLRQQTVMNLRPEEDALHELFGSLGRA